MNIQLPPLALHPDQQAILADRSRYRVIRAGRRFGKTLIAIEQTQYPARRHGLTARDCESIRCRSG